VKIIKEKHVHVFFICLCLVILIPFFFKDRVIKEKSPKVRLVSYLSYEDLIKLAYNKKNSYKLYKKLQKQLDTPYIVNRINESETISPKLLKDHLRIAHWNIQRGFNIEQIKTLLASSDTYYYIYRNNIREKSQDSFRRELKLLSTSDIISLNEVDIGMPRTNYRNNIDELATSLGYNYAFATEFIELGPIIAMLNIDSKKYCGLHGNAILSKYPIKNVEVVRLPDTYKWYEEELKRRSLLEGARRIGAKGLFREQIFSEVRRGGRNAIIADIELPNKEIVTVVSTHLEDRCFPKGRFKQMEYLLTKLKYKRTPLILAGDFNTTTSDSIPTSFKKEVIKRIKDPNFLARQAIFLTIPILPPGVGNLSAAAISTSLKYKDPAVVSIPLLSPNGERKLFTSLKDFKFYDGGKFNFEGDSNKSSNGKRGLLSDSNERQLKGFESTFEFTKPNVIGYYKLDWFFVKPKRKRFEPYNGQTLKLVNESFPSMISDHDPITVDLTLY